MNDNETRSGMKETFIEKEACPVMDLRMEVEVVFEAPHAREVFVTGDFNGWRERDLRLRKDASGFWRAQVWLAPGRYQYRFIVDGKCQNTHPASQTPHDFGYSNGVLEVG
jgi:1,4-alpha-glucan branching enzyme